MTQRHTSRSPWTIDGRRLRIDLQHWAIWLFFALVGVVVFAVWMLMSAPRPLQLFVFVATDYDMTLPPNGWAREDWDCLNESLSLNMDPGRFHQQSRDQLTKRLEEFLSNADPRVSRRPFSGEKQALLFYISATGVVDSNGEACLLLPGSQVYPSTGGDGKGSEATWMPLKDVFAVICKCENRPDLRDVPKIVFLDANRLYEDWSIGVIQNPFAEAVKELVANYSNLCVVNSTSANQVGHVAFERGGSVFGSYVAEALAGGTGKRTIQFADLSKYLQRNVSDWVRQRRATEQTPMVTLAPEMDTDFLVCRPLSHYHWSPAEFSFERQSLLAFAGEKLDAKWQQVGKLDYRALARQKPIEIADLCRSMKRAESLWQGGYYYLSDDSLQEQDRNAFVTTLHEAQKRVDDLMGTDTEPLPLVGLTISRRVAPPDELVKARTAWEAQQPVQGKESTEPKERPSVHAAAEFAWERALSAKQGLNDDELRSLVEFINKAAGEQQQESPFDVKETFLLRALLQEMDWKGNDSRLARLARGAVGLFDAAEKASSPCDLRVLQWIQPRAHQLDSQFRTGVFDNLFIKESLEEADKRSDPEPADSLYKEYSHLKSNGDKLGDAYLFMDRFCLEFPWVAQFALLNPGTVWSPDKTKDLDGLTKDLKDLQKSLGCFVRLRKFLIVDPDLTDFQNESIDTLVPEKEKLEGLPGEKFREFANGLAKSESFATPRDIRCALAVLATPLHFEGREGIRAKLLKGATLDYSNAEGDVIAPSCLPRTNLRHPLLDLVVQIPRVADGEKPSLFYGDASNVIRNEVAGLTESLFQGMQKIKQSDTPDNVYRLPSTARLLAGLGVLPNVEPAKFAIQKELEKDLIAYRGFQKDRILRDFWGKLDRREFFFLEAAKKLDTANPAIYAQLEQVANQWKPLNDKTQYVEVGNAPVTLKIRWEPTPEFPMGFPEGWARVQADGKEFKLATCSASTSESIEVETRPGEKVILNTFFRGHKPEAAEANARESLANHIVECPAPPHHVTVGIKDETNRTVHIVVVLDCSYSMDTADDGPEGGQRRIDVAKDALKHFCNQQLHDSDTCKYRIGFVLFGHRSGYQRVSGKWVPYHLQGTGERPPGDDVEEVPDAGLVSLDGFDVTDVTDKMQPIGVTPLYYAMNVGLNRLKGASGSDKYLFVLTDGVEWTDSKTPAEKGEKYRGEAGARQLQADLKKSDVTVAIFRIGKHNAEESEFERENFDPGVTQLKTYLSPVANICELNSATNFSSKAKEVLDERRVAVRVNGTSQEPPWWLEERGEPQFAKLATPSPSTEISLWRKNGPKLADSGEMALEGGERIELERTNGKLGLVAFEPRDGFKPLEGGVESRFKFFVRPPQWSGESASIDIAMVPQGSFSFAPRPKFVWAEVWPTEQPQRKFFFCDRLFLPGYAVPVLSLPIQKWDYGNNAQLVLRFRNELPSRTRELRVGDEDELQAYGLKVQRISPNEYRLKEDIPQGSAPRHVQFVPAASHTTRRFFWDEFRAEHEFVFAEEVGECQIQVIEDHDEGWETVGPVGISLQMPGK